MQRLKGILPQPKKEEKQPVQQAPSFGESAFGMANVINSLRKEVAQMVSDKFDEIDKVLEDIRNSKDENSKKIDDKVAEFHQTAVGMLQDIKSIPHIVGNAGKDADEEAIASKVMDRIPVRDEEKMTKSILAKVPKISEEAITQRLMSKMPDEARMTKRILGSIPKQKASLQVIREKVEIDPMSIIDQIMKLPKGKFRIPKESVDGLEQTMRSFESQLGKGYLHGGGDTVAAGTNITIAVVNGVKVISSSGGSGSGYQIPLSGGLTGTNTWTTAPHELVIDNVPRQRVQTDGTIMWTVSGSGPFTTVLTNAPLPTFDIYSSS